jgi:hypothetical protein
MREILPRVFTWRVVWPQWSLESYWLRFPGGSVLIDPMEAFGLDDITAAGDVAAIVLTVGWHERQAHLFAMRNPGPSARCRFQEPAPRPRGGDLGGCERELAQHDRSPG